MKFAARLFLVIAMAFTTCTLSAQTVVSTNNNIKWSLQALWPHVQAMNFTAYNVSGSPYTEGISTGIIKIDENSIIATAQLDHKDYGVVRVNKDMTTQWNVSITGFPVATGIFHNKVLVVASTDVGEFKGITNNFIGYIIDEKTGQILVQKNFFTASEQYYEQPVFLLAPDGSSFKMAVRTSNLTKKMHFGLAFHVNKGVEEYFDTQDFKVLEFNDNLDVVNTVKPVLPEGFFIGATTNNNGDIFLMTSYAQGYIEIAKYENGKTAASKILKLPVSMGDDFVENLSDSYLFTSKTDQQNLLFAISYPNGNGDRELVAAKFNFKDGTIGHNTQVIDRDYLKELKKSYVPFSKKYDDVDLGAAKNFEIKDVIENNGKLIIAMASLTNIVSNIQGIGTTSRLDAYDVLVNIYDDKSNLQYQQIIPRTYNSTQISWNGVDMHCKNDVLYIISNNNKGINGFKTLYGQIDLKTGTITNITGISKEGIKNSYSTDPYATLWFDKQFIANYMEVRGWSAGSEDAHMQLVTY